MKHSDTRFTGGQEINVPEAADRLLRQHAAGQVSRREFARRAAILGAGVPSVAMLISACGGADRASTSTGAGDAGGAAAARLPATTIVTQIGPSLSLDPDGVGELNKPSQTAYLAGYDALTIYKLPPTAEEAAARLAEGDSGLAVPQLAESWETAQGGKLYRFTLRDGVVSEFGNTMTAEDVVWSAQKSFGNEASGAFVLKVIGGVAGPESVTAVDDLTVEFKVESGDWLPIALGFYFGGGLVVHDSTEIKKHVTRRDPWGQRWLSRNLAGFGPYRIVEGDPSGNKITFEARSDYWGEKRALNRVVQQSVPEEGSRLQLLLTGQSSMAFGLSPSQLDKVESSPNAKVAHIDAATTIFLPLTREGVWGEPEVRQAIAKAIPYDAILGTVLRERAQPYRSILLPFLPGFTDEFAYAEDLEAARAVLSDVSEPLTLSYTADAEIDQQIALLLQSALGEAGFQLELQKQPFAEFNTKRYDGGNAFWIDTRAAPGVAAVKYYFDVYTGDPRTVGFYNFFGYRSREMDGYSATVGSGSADEIAEATTKGQELFMSDLPMIPVAWIGENYAISSAVDVPFAYSGNGAVLWRDLVAAS